MTTNYHTPITTGAAANAAIINAPLAQLDAAIALQSASVANYILLIHNTGIISGVYAATEAGLDSALAAAAAYDTILFPRSVQIVLTHAKAIPASHYLTLLYPNLKFNGVTGNAFTLQSCSMYYGLIDHYAGAGDFTTLYTDHSASMSDVKIWYCTVRAQGNSNNTQKVCAAHISSNNDAYFDYLFYNHFQTQNGLASVTLEMGYNVTAVGNIVECQYSDGFSIGLHAFAPDTTWKYTHFGHGRIFNTTPVENGVEWAQAVKVASYLRMTHSDVDQENSYEPARAGSIWLDDDAEIKVGNNVYDSSLMHVGTGATVTYLDGDRSHP